MTGERGAWLTRGLWMDTPAAEQPEIIPHFRSVSTKWDFSESLTYRSQINHMHYHFRTTYALEHFSSLISHRVAFYTRIPAS